MTACDGRETPEGKGGCLSSTDEPSEQLVACHVHGVQSPLQHVVSLLVILIALSDLWLAVVVQGLEVNGGQGAGVAGKKRKKPSGPAGKPLNPAVAALAAEDDPDDPNSPCRNQTGYIGVRMRKWGMFAAEIRDGDKRRWVRPACPPPCPPLRTARVGRL